ncbi:MAG: peptide chain release factor 1 [Bacilli bacterium]|nr:peptide chain release factor 1 [Bacilli bacterium]
MLNRLITTRLRLEEIDEQLSNESVLKDVKLFKTLSIERASLADVVDKFNEYEKLTTQSEEAKLMMNEDDKELAELGKEEYSRLEIEINNLINEMQLLLLPKDPNDDKNIIVEIRGAVGGDEANLFAGDLFRMYIKYAEQQNWKIQMVDENATGIGGYSFVAFMIKGTGAYSKLKFESGAHRVQRVPKTEASGRIHTSTATVLVMPEADEIELDIKNSDLQVDTFRSQGAGGQSVNKTESAVRITHLPTGLAVACQTEKSQLQNKEIAMRLLRAKIYAQLLEEQEAKLGSERKLKVGTGERSEKIRTYNFPQNRLTDHRISLTLQKLDRILDGDLNEVIDALIHFDQQQKLLGNK